jgi:hypothetical protein
MASFFITLTLPKQRVHMAGYCQLSAGDISLFHSRCAGEGDTWQRQRVLMRLLSKRVLMRLLSTTASRYVSY